MDDHSTTRTEQDSLGTVEIEADKLWGAQSQRSLKYFAIGHQVFPAYFIHDFALVKKAAAQANLKLGQLDDAKARLIMQACDDIISGKHDDQFPLSVWQTGSGTQTNMNLNEVIANIGNRLAGQALGCHSPLHPNDHVNMSQSSNDVFPTVMHVVAARLGVERLLPALDRLQQSLAMRQEQFRDTIKIGRTHMMDATPITLGQEFGAFRAQTAFAASQLNAALQACGELAIGGTAVGTGLNSPALWAETVVGCINELFNELFNEIFNEPINEPINGLSIKGTNASLRASRKEYASDTSEQDPGFQFKVAGNKFSQLAAHDALTNLHGQLNLLATALFKIANDIRLMNSGPRCGLSEIAIPANEPGSSIMPGKVNPTQVEALTMVCVRVMGNNTAVSIAASQGQFQLNVYKPLIIHTIMESITLLSDAMNSFNDFCLQGITANEAQLQTYTERSLMLVTALTPHIGYDNAARAAKYAHDNKTTLKQAVVHLELLSEAEFNILIRPESMLGP